MSSAASAILSNLERVVRSNPSKDGGHCKFALYHLTHTDPQSGNTPPQANIHADTVTDPAYHEVYHLGMRTAWQLKNEGEKQEGERQNSKRKVSLVNEKFRWYSMTKAIVCAAGCRMVERGELDLDVSVGEYLLEFSQQNLRGVQEPAMEVKPDSGVDGGSSGQKGLDGKKGSGRKGKGSAEKYGSLPSIDNILAIVGKSSTGKEGEQQASKSTTASSSTAPSSTLPVQPKTQSRTKFFLECKSRVIILANVAALRSQKLGMDRIIFDTFPGLHAYCKYLAHSFDIAFYDTESASSEADSIVEGVSGSWVFDGTVSADTLPSPPPSLTPVERPMTVRQLFTHTSGLGYGPGVEFRYATLDTRMKHEYHKLCEQVEGVSGHGTIKTLADWCQGLGRASLLAQPGSKFEYSYSIDLLGRVLEVAAGRVAKRSCSLAEIVQTEVLDPCSMADTDWTVEHASELVPLYKVERKRDDRGHQDNGGGTLDKSNADNENDDGGLLENDVEEETAGEATQKKTIVDGAKEGCGSPEIVELDGREYLSGRQASVLSGGGGVGLIKGGLVGTCEDYLRFLQMMTEGDLFATKEMRRQALEVNQLPLATEGRVQRQGKSSNKSTVGWNLLGALEVGKLEEQNRVHGENNEKTDDEKTRALDILRGSFSWGGFAGTKFTVYPKVRAAWVSASNVFGLNKASNLTDDFDIAILCLSGISEEVAREVVQERLEARQKGQKGKGKKGGKGGKNGGTDTGKGSGKGKDIDSIGKKGQSKGKVKCFK
eukprot:TRINITY_DN2838_c0_g1_i1.p1 TRINITY_DN2838_c0_g1~~TRINITY_DN2838_c0_g1_i1.p1  ORF type:complete len:770 (-),score=89.56 TRINITY_DN2838_c0_g1_i1:423-2732(-)